MIPVNVSPANLAGGSSPNEGRVEVFDHYVTLVMICDDYWTVTEASVVCRQLGFPGAQSAVNRGEGLLMCKLKCTHTLQNVNVNVTKIYCGYHISSPNTWN